MSLKSVRLSVFQLSHSRPMHFSLALVSLATCHCHAKDGRFFFFFFWGGEGRGQVTKALKFGYQN